jgi:catechol 2,3-dioxygenase-like lactoylglutathione lyase family enzyme
VNDHQTQKSDTMFTSVGVIFRPVTDLEKARDFYGTTLGLKEEWRSPDGSTAYSAGSGPIIIVFTKADRIESEAQFNFETPDISRAYRAMKESGAPVTDIKIAGETSMFFFKDPDGNTMMVWACHLPDEDLPQYRE